MSTLREQLVGAWELIEYSAHLSGNETDKKYPMGPKCQGIIMYTPDGYMSAQLLQSAQKSTDADSSSSAGVDQMYVGYTGQFYLDEDGDALGPVLMHHMGVTNLPALLGDTQRRLVKIVEEEGQKFLLLAVEGTMRVEGEDRNVRVRWRRMRNNQAQTPPQGGKL